MDSRQHLTKSSLSYQVFRSLRSLDRNHPLLMHSRDNLRFPLYIGEKTLNHQLVDKCGRRSYEKINKIFYHLNDVLTCGIHLDHQCWSIEEFSELSPQMNCKPAKLTWKVDPLPLSFYSHRVSKPKKKLKIKLRCLESFLESIPKLIFNSFKQSSWPKYDKRLNILVYQFQFESHQNTSIDPST